MEKATMHGLFLLCFVSLALSQKPHIVFIVADDLGWNDVGFHNPDLITPNIDKLARDGVILNQSYVQPVCTPSRNSFMTGIYPFKSGLQHDAILPKQAVCSPLNQTHLPQKLKALGYATHMIGKWHLGFCNWKCTPTYRGFDTFYGFYNGAEDYYSHIIQGGADFRDNNHTVRADGEYSAYNGTRHDPLAHGSWLMATRHGRMDESESFYVFHNMYSRRATQIIQKHNPSQPLFLYLPFQLVHEPIQVPERYEKLYPKIRNEGRRKYCGMDSALDEAIGNVTTALKQKGIYDETLIIFTADNGGWPTYYGNNYPLRGSKITVFEGGTRASAFVHGTGLQKKGEIYNGLMHAVDWNPTILSIAGGTPDDGIDGIDQWDSISQGRTSKRTEFIYNLDDTVPALTGHAAIRVGDFKLIQGFPGPYPFWYKPQSEEEDYEIKEIGKDKILFGTMLFNITADPNEYHDLSWKHRDIVDKLKSKMEEYKKQMIPANNPRGSPDSNPDKYNGYWSPGWC